MAKISGEALRDHFDADNNGDGWEASYLANKTAIDTVAIGKIKAGAEEPVLISKRDF